MLISLKLNYIPYKIHDISISKFALNKYRELNILF